MKKNFLYFCILLIIGAIIFLFYGTIRLDYTNDIIPYTTYSIRINRFTKNMRIREFHSCSSVNCKGTTEKYSAKITNEEYGVISKIINKHYNLNELVTALSYIGRNEEVFCNNSDDYYDIEEDTNRDGKVTYREIGNNRLSLMYKN